MTNAATRNLNLPYSSASAVTDITDIFPHYYNPRGYNLNLISGLIVRWDVFFSDDDRRRRKHLSAWPMTPPHKGRTPQIQVATWKNIVYRSTASTTFFHMATRWLYSTRALILPMKLCSMHSFWNSSCFSWRSTPPKRHTKRLSGVADDSEVIQFLEYWGWLLPLDWADIIPFFFLQARNSSHSRSLILGNQ